MSKITISYYRKVYKEFIDEKISMSRMIELLNEKANSTLVCKSCKRELDAHALPETGLCTACFTTNA